MSFTPLSSGNRQHPEADAAAAAAVAALATYAALRSAGAHAGACSGKDCGKLSFADGDDIVRSPAGVGADKGHGAASDDQISNREAFAAVLAVEDAPAAAYSAAEAVMEAALAAAAAVAAGKAVVDWSVHAAAMPQGNNLLYGEYGDAAAFEARMMALYDALVAEEVRAWEADGAVPRWPEAWQWREYVAQLAPFNLVDGAWLAGTAALVGPTDSVSAALHSIHYDETGNGVVAQNHAKVYLDLLEAMDLVEPIWREQAGGSGHPIIGAPAFAASPLFLDSAFDNAAMQLAASLLPLRYKPEICGFTLWLEFFASPINARLAREAAPFLPDTIFFRLHGAIDNVAAGHGRQALDAVHDLLSAVPRGAEREALFRRVWRGFVAFQTTMDSVMAELETLDAPLARVAGGGGGSSPATEVAPVRAWAHEPVDAINAAVDALLVQKAAFAKDLHGEAVVAGGSLNDAFAALERGEHTGGAAALRAALAASPHVVPGKPHRSALVTTLVGFRGPMYCIFSDNEIALLSAWVASLDSDESEPAQAEPAHIDYSDAALAAAISAMMGEVRKAGARAHRASTSIGGRGVNALLGDASVSDDELVRVLADDATGRAAFAAAIAPGRPMARALGRYAGLLARWEAAGCPVVDGSS
ncbi:uncharacterized protein AMSG_09796 [Thecamonas trahens ATCC 50062]|uniref:Uncharacterized protein n=1 Tax=Thecamonas trahens ATCC 50062 TaxID=461836 RepID=A0A0L0DP79_THETB|nr:hypothetical protein AMSG_09796 [Thecamonas trahens ATCC 50062]KNC53846.1 hypothetical protein AMSG_09796 [Thecamonas trahens ATCC 50062]|eukprot:XP_013754227.1 hypothetical protein AMSG_09796 [Thecamonas trahens ATCC 50062]